MLPLPDLTPADQAAPDLTIRMGRVDPPSPQSGIAAGTFWSANGNHLYLHWDDVGTFLVRGGSEIVIDPVPAASQRELGYFLVGPPLAALLHQRGSLVLHASAVTTPCGAVLFMGDSGWGKSSVAAAFYQRGYPVISDDICAIRTTGDESMIFPGFSVLHLWPESAAVLAGGRELMRVHGHSEKRCLPVPHNFSIDPLPLRRIYLLDEAETQGLVAMAAARACVQLIRHTYMYKSFGISEIRSNFHHCAALSDQIPVARLSMSWVLGALPELVDLIETDLDE